MFGSLGASYAAACDDLRAGRLACIFLFVSHAADAEHAAGAGLSVLTDYQSRPSVVQSSCACLEEAGIIEELLATSSTNGWAG